MEEENKLPDLYEREEQCLKSIKTVRKAIFIRIAVAALMIFAVVSVPGQPAVWGLMVFVLVIDILGAWPLVQEWRRQKKLFASLVAQEEE